MRVFVTGATGVLGRHLVHGLVAAGHQVTAATRTPGKVSRRYICRPGSGGCSPESSSWPR